MCTKEGCKAEALQKGMCTAHYHQDYRKRIKAFDSNEFWEFVKKELRING